MGDRTYVEIHISEQTYNRILREHSNNCEDTFADEISADSITTEEGITTFSVSDCNYAQWYELEEILAEEEFDKFWEAGGDYPGGEGHQRIIDGKLKYFEITEGEKNEQESLQGLLNHIKEETDPEVIKKEIQKRIDNLIPFEVKPLNKPNSVDFIEETV